MLTSLYLSYLLALSAEPTPQPTTPPEPTPQPTTPPEPINFPREPYPFPYPLPPLPRPLTVSNASPSPSPSPCPTPTPYDPYYRIPKPTTPPVTKETKLARGLPRTVSPSRRPARKLVTVLASNVIVDKVK